jgi:formylglycine-generating enzyme required for sulfatase activity
MAPEARAEGKKLALLVGVDKYPEGSGFRTLPYTERDVEQLAELLLASGYRHEHVRVFTLARGNKNPRFLPTVRNVRREFDLLAADCKPEDALLVALSGHGISRKVKVRGGDGREHEKEAPFFCPIEADINDPESLLSIDDFYARLEGSNAGAKVLLVDACRNDPTEGKTGAIEFRMEPPPPSVAALFACSNGEVAWDSRDLGGGHGVFFYYVIEGLKGAADTEAGNRDRKVTLAELTSYTQDKVPGYVSFRRGKRQMPLLLGSTGRITLLELSRTRPADIITSKSTGLKLKLIPTGEFFMGSSKADDPDASDDETPRHWVRVRRPFYLGRTEVTVGQFRRVVEVSGYRTTAERRSAGGAGLNEQTGEFTNDPKYTWRTPGFPQSDDHPVTNVSWDDAIAFCNKLSELDGLRPYYRFDADGRSGGDGYRLPTEAEWEYACRAGGTTRYQSGDDPESLVQVGNVADGTLKHKGGVFSNWSAIASRDGYVFTAPVGRFRPNRFGLFDMHGNVLEWCWDEYKSNSYQNSSSVAPGDSTGAADYVFRGGGWSDHPRYARSAQRRGRVRAARSSTLGFRVARNLSGLSQG